VYASCDGKQCSNSRSVSWRTETQPTYKQVDPLEVFNTITGGVAAGPGSQDRTEAHARHAARLRIIKPALIVLT